MSNPLKEDPGGQKVQRWSWAWSLCLQLIADTTYFIQRGRNIKVAYSRKKCVTKAGEYVDKCPAFVFDCKLKKRSRLNTEALRKYTFSLSLTIFSQFPLQNSAFLSTVKDQEIHLLHFLNWLAINTPYGSLLITSTFIITFQHIYNGLDQCHLKIF